MPVTDPCQQLLDALHTLDTAFAAISEPSFTVGGCTHCYTDTDLAALTGPASLVPQELISSVAAASVDHWDDFPALYRRMTPRIIRSLVTGQLHVDHGLVASRLLAAGWRHWPAPERDALENVWHVWWQSALHEHPAGRHITDVLETVSVSTGTLAPWLAIWSATRTETADRHLADALDGWLRWGELADLRLGFYNELHAASELLPWLLSIEEGRIDAAKLIKIEDIAYG
ncbi:hypothetical protein GCM10010440_59460 [Kitasatospora cinereorecta]